MIPNILSTKSFSVNEATSFVIKEQEQDPLWKACYLGEEEKFEELLQSVSDINIKGYNGTTPLLAATINQKTSIIQLLLSDSRVDVNAEDNQGNSVLAFACENPNNQNVIDMITSHPNFNWSFPSSHSALLSACKNGYLQVVQKLLDDKTIDPNMKDIQGKTPLHYALIHNQFECAELLFNDERTNPSLIQDEYLSVFEIPQQNHVSVLVSIFTKLPKLNTIKYFRLYFIFPLFLSHINKKNNKIKNKKRFKSKGKGYDMVVFQCLNEIIEKNLFTPVKNIR